MTHVPSVAGTLRRLKRFAQRAMSSDGSPAAALHDAGGFCGDVTQTHTGHVVHLQPGLAPVPWQPLQLKPGLALLVRAELPDTGDIQIRLDLRSDDRSSGVGVIGGIKFFDAEDAFLPGPYRGCRASPHHTDHLTFGIVPMRAAAGDGHVVTPPRTSRRVEIRLRHADGASPVWLHTPPQVLRSDKAPSKASAAEKVAAGGKAAASAAGFAPAAVPPIGWTQMGRVKVTPGQLLVWASHLEDPDGASPKAAVLDVRTYGESGKPVNVRIGELASSTKYPNYAYLESAAAGAGQWQTVSFTVPPGVFAVQAMVHTHAGGPELGVVGSKLQALRLEDIPDMIAHWPIQQQWVDHAVKLAQAAGALTLQERLLSALVQCMAAAPEVVKRWRAVRYELDELAPDWYPRLSVRAAPAQTGKLTVCHLHKTAYPFENTGGAIRCLNTLKSQLDEGLDPYVITPPGYPAYDGVFSGDVPPWQPIAGSDHFLIGPNTTGIRTLSPPMRVQFAAVQSASIVARRGASLIHAASGVRGYELALQAFALRDVFDIPVIYEVRSFHEHTWAPAGPQVFDLERTQLRIRKENRCMELADHVVTISESMRRILIERGVPDDKIDVIPNGIDAEEFRDAPPPAQIEVLAGAQLVVGYVSNMSKREGHRHLIEAVARLREGGLDCRCLFVGHGPERKALDELVARLGLENAVHFAGEVDHHQIKAYYMAIDVFVIPRIPDYAADWVTPLKPYEAMALGRPLIVTDLPALREVVGDGERGLIAEPASADSLAQAIRRYADDAVVREQTALNARQWVFEHRTWAANAKRYREIYERVVARHGATRGAMRSQHARAG